jgi:hypothetical protein
MPEAPFLSRALKQDMVQSRQKGTVYLDPFGGEPELELIDIDGA